MEFQGLPMKTARIVEGRVISQVFSSFCFTKNDHLVGCSHLGCLFVIEVMSVIQIVDPTSLICSGTKMTTRTVFKKVIAN